MISFSEESKLPIHPQSEGQYRKVNLQTNQYRVFIPEATKVYVYTLSFSPAIPSDNSKLKKTIVRLLRPEINKYLERFVHCGENLFSLKDLIHEIQTSSGDDDISNPDTPLSVDMEDTPSVSIECRHLDSVYTVKIINSGELDISNISSCKHSFLQFYNILLRDKLKSMKLVQLGSNRDHFDPSNAKKINGFPASIWPGYFTSINLLRGGLMMNIDCSFRLVRNDSVLDIIQEVFRKYGNNCRDHIKTLLIDRIVMTFYGSQLMYRIDDVLFDETPQDIFSHGSVDVSYLSYFRDKYQAQIHVRNQPLLLVKRSVKASPIKLVPELCRMTGSDSLNNDNKLKKEISVHTRLKPEKRQQDIQELADRLHYINNDYWNMETSVQPQNVEGLQLPHPLIITGNKRIPINDKASFKLIDTKLLKTVPLERWQIFFTERDQHLCQDLVKSLQNMGRTYEILIKNPLTVCVPIIKNMETAFSTALRDKVHAQAQLILILMPKNLTHLYKTIKQILITEKPVPSQIILTSSAEKRDLSVYSKITMQIACKIGGGLWGVSLPSTSENTMLVGIDVCHNTFQARQSVLGFCASLDSSFTKYFTKVAFHDPNQEISSVLTPVFLESLKQYYLNNSKKKPECIIMYRDGVGTSQYSQVVNHEIPQLVAAIKEFDKTWKPEIIAVVVNKRVNQRFFLKSGNPHAGIVVDKDVVWGHYNFYLMSHNVNCGSMTPTHYNVVVNESKMSSRALYELTYNLCFMYYNWQGGIRVPAPCMYAHKIAYLIGKHTGVNFNPKLAPTYFYL